MAVCICDFSWLRFGVVQRRDGADEWAIRVYSLRRQRVRSAAARRHHSLAIARPLPLILSDAFAFQLSVIVFHLVQFLVHTRRRRRLLRSQIVVTVSNELLFIHLLLLVNNVSNCTAFVRSLSAAVACGHVWVSAFTTISYFIHTCFNGHNCYILFFY